MSDLVLAALSACGVAFVAELGDKTQLLALGFGARHRLRTVVIGLTLGYAVATAVAAVAGGIIGAALPERPIAIVAGTVFLVFALLATRRPQPVDDEHVIRARSAVASIALTIALAEMGDKTQVATATLASRADPVGTWIGATAGMALAGLLGAFAGRHVGDRVDERSLRLASAVLFAGVGIAVLISALRP